MVRDDPDLQLQSSICQTTLEGVLAQDPGPEVMQIEVVDDHSTDDPAAIVGSLGRGRVDYFRQRSNVGITRNFATCLNRAHGRLVHMLHGDDCARPGLLRAHVAALRGESGDSEPRSAGSLFIDETGASWRRPRRSRASSGVLPDALERLALEQRIMTPSMVVRREVYERLGGFDDRLPCSEDWEMWVRIAAHYPIGYRTRARLRPTACIRTRTRGGIRMTPPTCAIRARPSTFSRRIFRRPERP